MDSDFVLHTVGNWKHCQRHTVINTCNCYLVDIFIGLTVKVPASVVIIIIIYGPEMKMMMSMYLLPPTMINDK